MTQAQTDLYVTSLEEAETALHYARIAMLPSFSVTCAPKVPFPANREDLQRRVEYTLAPYCAAQRLPELLQAVYRTEAGDFAAAQQRAYAGSCSMYTFVRKARLDVTADFFTSCMDANYLFCIAAEIGEKLCAQLGPTPTVERILQVYQRWINTTFRYLSTGQPQDHSAAALLRSGTGVCQAIAALTVLVLPQLGLLTRYVSGQGEGNNGFGPHAWNAVRVPTPAGVSAAEDHLQWYHVDFTFGMNGATPHTLTARSAESFQKTHIWDRNTCTREYLNRSLHRAEALQRAEIVLQANENRWQLGGITVTSPRAVLTGSAQQGHWIDPIPLLRFLGGGCEYIASENRLRICLNNRQYLVEDGASYLNGPAGYLKISVLRHLPLQLFGAGDTLSLKVVPT